MSKLAHSAGCTKMLRSPETAKSKQVLPAALEPIIKVILIIIIIGFRVRE